jgi:hypothetical protein
MPRRVLFPIAGLGLVTFVFSLSYHRAPIENVRVIHDHHGESMVTPVINSKATEIEHLNELLKSDSQRAVAYLAKLEADGRIVPPPQSPEIAALTDNEKSVFTSEIESLISEFEQMEKKRSEVLFDGERNGTKYRSVRIHAPGNEELDQMGKAYSAILGKYPEDSKLHTALWARISEMVSDFSQDRLVMLMRGANDAWHLATSTRRASDSNWPNFTEANDWVPDEQGRVTFSGPSKIIVLSSPVTFDSAASIGAEMPEQLRRYVHFLVQ